jgi:hypothetical protein
MRCIKSLTMAMTVLVMFVLLSGLSYAEMEHSGCKEGKKCAMDKMPSVAHIKVLRDSALALQTSNPDLAKGLNDLANKKEEKMKKWQQWNEQHDATMKLLKDSAAALKASNATLAQELETMSKTQHMEEQESGEKI